MFKPEARAKQSIYRRALAYELSSQCVQVEQEKEILVPYKDIQIPGQRLDLLVGGRIIVELKCVEQFAPIHQAQLISYLKTTHLRLGLLINFKTTLLKDGIKRVKALSCATRARSGAFSEC